MIDVSVIDSQLAGRFKDCLSIVIGDEYFDGKHHPCPACGGKDRFRFDDKFGRGDYFCGQCGAGDAYGLVRKVKGCSFPQACKMLLEAAGGDTNLVKTDGTRMTRREPQNDFNNENYLRAMNYRDCLRDIGGTPVEAYWRNRGVWPETMPKDVKYHPWDQALIQTLRDKTGKITQMQRVFLTRDGYKRDPADLEAEYPGRKQKMFMPRWQESKGSSVKLYKRTDFLAIAEGVETALAFYCKYQLPVWATTSRIYLEYVEIPVHIRHVLILADNDISGDGQTSAEKLRRRLAEIHELVEVKMPAKPGTDFCDLWGTRAGVR